MTESTPAATVVASPLTDLAKAQIALLIRKGIVIASTAALAHHLDAKAVNSLADSIDVQSVTEGLFTIGAIVWSWLEAKRQNTKVVLAAATGLTSAKASDADTTILLRSGVVPKTPVSATAIATAVSAGVLPAAMSVTPSIPQPPEPPGFQTSGVLSTDTIAPPRAPTYTVPPPTKT